MPRLLNYKFLDARDCRFAIADTIFKVSYSLALHPRLEDIHVLSGQLLQGYQSVISF